MEKKIDFVLTWVDGADEAWLAEKRKYQPGQGADGGESRYRDWETLPYWFRGVEKYAPWVNKIWFVTWGHVPSWLNTAHPKLQIVRHEEFLKPEYLPTFNINSIELNFHKIKGLEEQFVFFNDDMFLLNTVKEEDFFKNGLPRDCCIETALVQDDIDNPFASILMNDAALINMHFQKREVIRRNRKKWFHPVYKSMLIRNLLMLPYGQFSSFKYTHMPSAFLKSTYEKVWEAEGERLDHICCNRFRTVFDVNQYLMKYWQYMEGMYEPQSPKIGKFCLTGRDDADMFVAIASQSYKMLCINDNAALTDFPVMKEKVTAAFQKILPEKSEFER